MSTARIFLGSKNQMKVQALIPKVLKGLKIYLIQRVKSSTFQECFLETIPQFSNRKNNLILIILRFLIRLWKKLKFLTDQQLNKVIKILSFRRKTIVYQALRSASRLKQTKVKIEIRRKNRSRAGRTTPYFTRQKRNLTKQTENYIMKN